MFGKVVNGRFIAPPVNSGRQVNVYQDAAWLAAHGFHELTAEEVASIQPEKREIKLSKLSIIDFAGDQWPAYKAKIEAAGAWDFWEAATYLVVGHPKFVPFWKELDAETRQAILKNCRY